MYRRALLCFGLFGLLLCPWPALCGQVAEQIPTGGALGYHEWEQELSEPTALTDTSFVVCRPSANAYIDRATAGLVVFRRILGFREQTFVPIPGVAGGLDPMSSKVYRVDDKTVVIPGAGPDGAFGSQDDTLILVGRLDTPAVATVRSINIGSPGPREGQKLVFFGPRCVSWLDGYRDASSFGGSQTLTVVHDLGGPGNYTQVIDLISVARGGSNGHLEPMGPGRFGMVTTGSDFTWGTIDDSIAVVTLDSPNNTVGVNVISLQEELRVPTGSLWPRYVGNDELFVLGAREDNIDVDDVTISINLSTSTPRLNTRSLVNASSFQGNAAAFDIVFDQASMALLPHAGPDGINGTFDDEIHILDDGLLTVLTPNVALAPNPSGDMVVPTELECGAMVFPMFGRQGGGPNDRGILILSAPDPVTNQRTTKIVLTFEDVAKVVPMNTASAMLFVDNGQAFHVRDMNTPTPVLAAVTGGIWDGVSEPIVLNPAVVVSTTAGSPAANFSVSDQIDLFKISHIWNFGSATSNLQGYDLKIGSPKERLTFADNYFGITLTDAPKNELCALFISLHREEIWVASDALFLLSAEDEIYSFFWRTDNSGNAFVVLPTPQDPIWLGHGAHYQWFTMNPISKRGWDLSDGLTITM